VQLPQEVRRSIEERAEAVGFTALKLAASALSAAYRDGRAAQLSSPDYVAAYLATRMPATFSATYAAIRQLPVFQIGSILDVGAGTGAASLAARAFYPEAKITMIERNRALAEAAREWLPEAEFRFEDVTRGAALARHDLVVAAYSVGEFGAATVRRLWHAAAVALLIIEPGTPRGFATILGLRQELLAAGARMAAPCPTETACPVVDPEWCHFAARVERSSIHRRIKGGELGYEDEKFSYVAVAREGAPMAPGRIVRRPRHQPGVIVLETCRPEGLRTERVMKRDREAFRAARHAGWGDAISEV
jgi:ribosomal protein RSM22 (predicted rRNA methylase)